jgi:hypothetical protein
MVDASFDPYSEAVVNIGEPAREDLEQGRGGSSLVIDSLGDGPMGSVGAFLEWDWASRALIATAGRLNSSGLGAWLAVPDRAD